MKSLKMVYKAAIDYAKMRNHQEIVDLLSKGLNDNKSDESV